MQTIKVGIIGAGRIGKVHAENIAKFVPEMEIKTIADPFMSEETVEFLQRLRIPNIVSDAEAILKDPEIKAVIVCSPTDLHAEYVIRAAEAGKDIFVEKPIDYRLDRVHAAIDAAKKAGVKLQVGFCRRFDHNHHAVYEAVRAGKIGDVNLVKISSRDPAPPTIDYVKVSGGIFYDMMVHDFDMARFLAGAEVTEVFAYGAVLVDPAIGEAGDVDTAVVSLKFANGAMGIIDNSRKAVYGYDQRVEVFGSKGAVMDVNDTPDNTVFYGEDGTVSGTCYKIMWDRYTGAFAAEQQAFADAVINDKPTPVTGEDGLYPILIAAAATKSMKEGRPVKISEIEG
ncbi:inositol 2-dehydrogenase [uncultured Dysosmobacter sp.]|uniref:inositol 2-dehydrogenase n=1 Tax=uncultured Dysosmobacter sp. TaxID=2591384 RepID=UPI00260DE94B|nr:inositol 2-dehydrogenase [uncultured Dysosmobacter sp.]